VIAVQNFDTSAFGDVTSCDNTRSLGRDRQALGPFDFHAQGNAFEVQNDVGDIFANTRNARKFVQNIINLYRCDGGTLQRRHQNAAQRVAHCQTKATLERLCDDSSLTCRVIARLDVQLLWLDQFSPIFVDHTSLHSCSAPHVQMAKNSRGFNKAVRGRAQRRGPFCNLYS